MALYSYVVFRKFNESVDNQMYFFEITLNYYRFDKITNYVYLVENFYKKNLYTCNFKNNWFKTENRLYFLGSCV